MSDDPRLDERIRVAKESEPIQELESIRLRLLETIRYGETTILGNHRLTLSPTQIALMLEALAVYRKATLHG